jgi:hypothetical protein
MRTSFASILVTLLAATACVSPRIAEGARETRVVTVKAFKPHFFFDGNQFETWVAFDLEAVEASDRPSKFRAVSVQNWSDYFSETGVILEHAAMEDSCPKLQIGGRYQIETISNPRMAKDVPGARSIISACTVLEP